MCSASDALPTSRRCPGPAPKPGEPREPKRGGPWERRGPRARLGLARRRPAMIPASPGQERATAARPSGRGLRLASPATATALGVLTLALLATLVLMAALAGQLNGGAFLANSGLPLTMGTIGAVGLVVARHQPGNPIG